MEWAGEAEKVTNRKRLPAWAVWNLNGVRTSFLQNKCTLSHVQEKGTSKADQLLAKGVTRDQNRHNRLSRRKREFKFNFPLCIGFASTTYSDLNFLFFNVLQPFFIGLILKAHQVRYSAIVRTGRVDFNHPRNAEVNCVEAEFFFNESGWLTKDVFLHTTDKFCPRWKLLYPGLHSRLFMDNLSVYKSASVVKQLEIKHLHIYLDS